MTGFQFFTYCKSFYSIDGGIYPIATELQIRKASKAIYKLRGFHGDTVDRERVRVLIESTQSMEECQA